MTSAVITYCGHIYHGSCLRKWLYVQETCPMCHASIKPSSNQMAGAGDAQPQQPQQQQHPPEQQPHPEHSHQEEQGSQGDGPHSTQRTCDEIKMKFSNSDRDSSKGSPHNLHLGANGDSQGLEHPSCSTEQSPSHEKCKSAMDETQELRDAD